MGPGAYRAFRYPVVAIAVNQTEALLGRIADLESRLAFQDDTIDQLNAVVVRQDARIERLELALRRVREQVEGLMPLVQGAPGEEPPPPHY
jgi:SlyX protein